MVRWGATGRARRCFARREEGSWFGVLLAVWRSGVCWMVGRDVEVGVLDGKVL